MKKERKKECTVNQSDETLRIRLFRQLSNRCSEGEAPHRTDLNGEHWKKRSWKVDKS